MKTLILVRHARSSWSDPADMEDFDRPLHPRGLRDASVMAEKLVRCAPKVERIISSPALRAIETAKIFANVLGVPFEEIFQERRMYEAGVASLLNIIHGIDNRVETAVLLGHNPGMTDLYNQLVPDDCNNLPTSSVVVMELPVERWFDVKPYQQGELVELMFPRNKKEKRGVEMPDYRPRGVHGLRVWWHSHFRKIERFWFFAVLTLITLLILGALIYMQQSPSASASDSDVNIRESKQGF